MKKTRTVAALSAAALVMTGGLLTTTAQTAAASTSFFVEYDSRSLQERGYGEFRADSDWLRGFPGDAIRACDSLADHWGIEVQLDISPSGGWDTDRIATTRGHSKGYCTAWKTGNIKEETRVAIRVCKVKGDSRACGRPKYGRA